jgi:hypothetical protein
MGGLRALARCIADVSKMDVILLRCELTVSGSVQGWGAG